MRETKADLLLHPIRLRIIQAFIPPKSLTAQQIGALLRDVPQATLYRHLNSLTRGGILVVVERRQVRGTTEKVYALLAGGAHLSPSDLATVSKEDHLRYFTTFVATLLGDFARYLERDHVDLFADGVGYHQVPLYLTDQEYARMVVEVNMALAPLAANEPGPDRRHFSFSSIMIPIEDVADILEGRPNSS